MPKGAKRKLTSAVAVSGGGSPVTLTSGGAKRKNAGAVLAGRLPATPTGGGAKLKPSGTVAVPANPSPAKLPGGGVKPKPAGAFGVWADAPPATQGGKGAKRKPVGEPEAPSKRLKQTKSGDEDALRCQNTSGPEDKGIFKFSTRTFKNVGLPGAGYPVSSEVAEAGRWKMEFGYWLSHPLGMCSG